MDAMNTELNDLENSIKQLEEKVRNSKQDIPRSADKTTTLQGGQYVYLKDITDMKKDITSIKNDIKTILRYTGPKEGEYFWLSVGGRYVERVDTKVNMQSLMYNKDGYDYKFWKSPQQDTVSVEDLPLKFPSGGKIIFDANNGDRGSQKITFRLYEPESKWSSSSYPKFDYFFKFIGGSNNRYEITIPSSAKSYDKIRLVWEDMASVLISDLQIKIL